MEQWFGLRLYACLLLRVGHCESNIDIYHCLVGVSTRLNAIKGGFRIADWEGGGGMVRLLWSVFLPACIHMFFLHCGILQTKEKKRVGEMDIVYQVFIFTGIFNKIKSS